MKPVNNTQSETLTFFLMHCGNIDNVDLVFKEEGIERVNTWPYMQFEPIEQVDASLLAYVAESGISKNKFMDVEKRSYATKDAPCRIAAYFSTRADMAKPSCTNPLDSLIWEYCIKTKWWDEGVLVQRALTQLFAAPVVLVSPSNEHIEALVYRALSKVCQRVVKRSFTFGYVR